MPERVWRCAGEGQKMCQRGSGDLLKRNGDVPERVGDVPERVGDVPERLGEMFRRGLERCAGETFGEMCWRGSGDVSERVWRCAGEN